MVVHFATNFFTSEFLSNMFAQTTNDTTGLTKTSTESKGHQSVWFIVSIPCPSNYCVHCQQSFMFINRERKHEFCIRVRIQSD